MGDELRATTITATGSNPEYQDDYTFHTSILQRFITLFQNRCRIYL